MSKVIKRSTSHHFFMKTVFINSTPDIFPNMGKSLFIPPGLFFIFPNSAFWMRHMLCRAKLYKITKLS